MSRAGAVNRMLKVLAVGIIINSIAISVLAIAIIRMKVP